MFYKTAKVSKHFANTQLILGEIKCLFSTHTISGLKVFFKVGLKYSIKYNSTSYRNVPGTKFVYNYKTLLSSDSNVSFPWFKTEINGIYSSINRAMVNIYLLLQ